MRRLTVEQRVRRARRLHGLAPRLDVARLLLLVAGTAAIAVVALIAGLELVVKEQQFESANCTMTDMGGVDRTHKEVMINCVRFEWVPIDGAGIQYGRVQKMAGHELQDQRPLDVGVRGVVLSCKPGAPCPKPGAPAEQYARESAQQLRQAQEASKK